MIFIKILIVIILVAYYVVGTAIIHEQERRLKSRENLLKLAKIRMDNQDKIIDLMANDLKTDYHSKEWVIQHYIEEINK